MKYKTSHMLAAAAIAAGVATFGVGTLQAATSTITSPTNKIITAIAEKFHLSTTEVQKVFEEQRALKEAEHKAEFTAKISQAVTDGKITEAQAHLITTKATELKSLKTNIKAGTQSQMHTAMKAQHEELKQWALDNKIPANLFQFKGGKEKGHHEDSIDDDNDDDTETNDDAEQVNQ